MPIFLMMGDFYRHICQWFFETDQFQTSQLQYFDIKTCTTDYQIFNIGLETLFDQVRFIAFQHLPHNSESRSTPNPEIAGNYVIYSQCEDITVILSGSVVGVRVIHFQNENCGYVITIILKFCQVYRNQFLQECTLTNSENTYSLWIWISINSQKS